MKQPVYIVDVMRDIVTATSTTVLADLQETDPLITGINYQYGHYNDVKQQQIQKGKTTKVDRYPLVWFIEDATIKKGSLGLSYVAFPRILIAHLSRKDYTRVQREDIVIRPVLYLIYEELLRQIKKSGKFMLYDLSLLTHSMTVKPHIGVDAKFESSGYLFDEPLDALEINNLELKTYLPNCQ